MILVHPSLPPRARGFTLIEMLVVLAVAALIASLAFPNIARGIGLAEYRSVQTEISGKLSEARAIALRSDAKQDFIIDASRREFRIEGQEAATIADGITIEQDSVITFFADGTASGNAIQLSWRGNIARIEVDPQTGRIRRTV